MKNLFLILIALIISVQGCAAQTPTPTPTWGMQPGLFVYQGDFIPGIVHNVEQHFPITPNPTATPTVPTGTPTYTPHPPTMTPTPYPPPSATNDPDDPIYNACKLRGVSLSIYTPAVGYVLTGGASHKWGPEPFPTAIQPTPDANKVPYNGAEYDLDMGVHNITANTITGNLYGRVMGSGVSGSGNTSIWLAGDSSAFDGASLWLFSDDNATNKGRAIMNLGQDVDALFRVENGSPSFNSLIEVNKSGDMDVAGNLDIGGILTFNGTPFPGTPSNTPTPTPTFTFTPTPTATFTPTITPTQTPAPGDRMWDEDLEISLEYDGTNWNPAHYRTITFQANAYGNNTDLRFYDVGLAWWFTWVHKNEYPFRIEFDCKTAPGTGNSYIVTLRKGTMGSTAADTVLSATITGATDRMAIDTCDPGDISGESGDYWGVRLTTSGSPLNMTGHVTVYLAETL